MQRHSKLVAVAVGALALLAAGCGGQATEKVSLGVSTKQQAATRGQQLRPAESIELPPGDGLPVTDGTNTLVFRSVKMTLEDIDLERDASSVDCENVNGDHPDCSDWVAGPILLNLPMNAQTRPVVEVEAQIGTYSLISFDISVPDGGDRDQEAYLARHPEMRDISIRAEGTFNGQPFTFVTAVRGDQEVAIDPPLQVTADGAKSFGVDLEFDVGSWFRGADGTLIDPSSICGLKESCSSRDLVEDNIRRMVEADSRDDGD